MFARDLYYQGEPLSWDEAYLIYPEALKALWKVYGTDNTFKLVFADEKLVARVSYWHHKGFDMPPSITFVWWDGDEWSTAIYDDQL